MAKENECYAYFTVTGSFDPDDISQRVGMAPTDRWRKGDVNPQTQCARSKSRWILGSRLEKALSIEAHVRDVLGQMDMNRAAFRQISEEFGGAMQVVANFAKVPPTLSFERKQIERLADYAVSVNLDFEDLQVEPREDS